MNDRDHLRKDYRATLNRICDVVGHPPISIDEGFTASIAERVESLSRDHHRLSELEEANRVPPMAQYAASLEHHEEHHAREKELETTIERLESERDQAVSERDGLASLLRENGDRERRSDQVNRDEITRHVAEKRRLRRALAGILRYFSSGITPLDARDLFNEGYCALADAPAEPEEDPVFVMVRDSPGLFWKMLERFGVLTRNHPYFESFPLEWPKDPAERAEWVRKAMEWKAEEPSS